MKTKLLLTSFFALILFTSCSSSSDDIQTSDPANAIPTTFFPLTSGNSWKYKVSNQGTDTYDLLTVGNNVTINSLTYKKMIGTADPSGVASGFYCTTLNNNNLRIDGSSLKLTGTVNYTFPNATPITIDLNDFVVFKQNAASGDQLSSVTGTNTQTINSIPLTFEYTLRSVAAEAMTTLVSDGVTYNDVKKSKLIFNLKITTTQTISGVPTPITIAVLDSQDVVVSTLHYANNKGMVYNKNVFNYAINPAVASLLPAGFPLTGNATQDEYLTTYTLN